MVYRWIQQQQDLTEPAQANSRQTNSVQEMLSAGTGQRSLAAPRHLAWLLVGDPTQLDEQEKQTLSFLCQHPQVNRAYEVAQQLITMVKERTADRLEIWMRLCANSEVIEVENFAFGLQKEFSALQAALTLPYSNDHVAYCTSSLGSLAF